MTERSELLAYLQQGATIITPNNRLSNEVIDYFFQVKTVISQEKPCCLPYQVFLQTLFKEHCFTYPKRTFPILLNSQQIRHLWQNLISKDRSQINSGLIEEIQEAWSRCQRWQIDLNHQAFSYTPQTQKFQQWSEAFQNMLDKLFAITEDQLVNFFLQENTLVSRKTIVWYCFDDYSPQQQALQQYLSEQGCTMVHLDLDKRSHLNAPTVYAAPDEKTEYQQLFHWVKECIKRGDKRIGVVVLDLQTQASILKRQFHDHLPSSSFNISLGQALSDFSLIAHALSWLNLKNDVLSNHEARLLLYSPYLAHSQTEMIARAAVLQDSYALQEETIDFSLFITELEGLSPKLADLLKTLTPFPEQAPVDEWIDLFITRLNLLGFPGEYPLNSVTYQCYQRFLLLFDDFKTLAFLEEKLSQKDALLALETLTNTTIFQPKKQGATLQILGLLEASGCMFDSLWVTQLTDECLPQKTRLSAFIPVILQQEKLMPHASAVRELSLAIHVMDRLKNSSWECVFSYPCLTKDKPNLPCPLLINLLPFKPYTLIEEGYSPSLENYQDNYELPLLSNENISGGTSLLANQAKCPFRAFAAHRLHAKKTLTTSDGLNAIERGKIIHKIMELLWKEIKNQENLFVFSEIELEKLITMSISLALEPYKRLRKHSFSSVIQDVELIRLRRLVQVSLEWERKRPPFEVEALEQAFTHTLGGINFNLRIDRLDKVGLNEKWVIDYKSSLPSLMPWKEDRPKEPQLLLYSLIDESIKALLFTGLKEGQVTCKGLSEQPSDLEGLNGIKTEERWADYREQWRIQLNTLAEEYSQGHCLPKPVSPSVCQQCDYQSLCRFQLTPVA